MAVGNTDNFVAFNGHLLVVRNAAATVDDGSGVYHDSLSEERGDGNKQEEQTAHVNHRIRE